MARMAIYSGWAIKNMGTIVVLQNYQNTKIVRN